MSAFKKLNLQDVFVTDYIAKKQWMASGSLTGSYNLQTLRGFSSSINAFSYPHDYYLNRSQDLVYNSSDHLYFRDSYGVDTFSGSRDMALQTTLTLSGSRKLRSEIGIISIPRTVYGVSIEPNSIILQPEFEPRDRFVASGYAKDSFTGEDQYTEDIRYWYGSNPIDTEDYIVSESNYITESADNEYVTINTDQQRIEIIDDGEGRLILSGASAQYTNSFGNKVTYTKPVRIIGDVIYNQGQILITDPEVARYYSTFSRHHLRWKSNQPIYTYNVYCRVKDSEMNFTQNPSATTGSDGTIRANITGSEFTPYVTSIGLYNDANELIAVAKTNRPLRKTDNIETTFVVKLDI